MTAEKRPLFAPARTRHGPCVLHLPTHLLQEKMLQEKIPVYLLHTVTMLRGFPECHAELSVRADFSSALSPPTVPTEMMHNNALCTGFYFYMCLKMRFTKKQGHKEPTQMEQQLMIPQHHARKMLLSSTEEPPLHSPLQIQPSDRSCISVTMMARRQIWEKAGEVGRERAQKTQVGGVRPHQRQQHHVLPDGCDLARWGGRGRGSYCSG